MDLFDPIQKAAEIEALVMRQGMRLYDPDKFRFQRFYNGIATSGSRGCQLRCIFCWNWERNLCPQAGGKFYAPHEVVQKLESVAGRKTNLARISGCEAILGYESAKHLSEIVLNSKLDFVVETNAVAIGYTPELLNFFKDANNCTFRISLKATNGLMWEKITGTSPWGFVYQQTGIQAIQKRHLPYKIAFMPQFVDYRQIDESNAYRLEEENLKYYPGVKARMQERGLKARVRA